jgi:Gpi18-like mannosyltransferase
MKKNNRFLNKISQYDERYLIIAIFLCAFILRLISLLLAQTHDIDFFRFVERSSMVINGEMSYQDFGDPKPLWTHTLAAWLYLFGIREFNASLLLIFVDLLGALVLLFIGKTLYGAKHGLLPFMLYLFLPFTILFTSAEGKMDVFPVLFVLLSFFFLLKKKYFLSSIFLGIGIGYKYLAGLYLIPFLFYILKEKNVFDTLKYVFVCGFSVFVVLLPFMVLSPTKFIEDTLLFFVTRNNTGYVFYHPYNFLPFFVPLIFILIGISLVIFNASKIRKFSYVDLIPLIFFFIMVTNLFNRVLFTQYFLYAIPFLCLILTKYVLEGKKWLFFIGCSMAFPLAMEYLNNFGLAISGGIITIEVVDTTPFVWDGIRFIGDVSVFTFFWVLVTTLFLFIMWNRELRKNNRLTHFCLKLK